MSDTEGQKADGGLGQDGTIPDSDKGIAAGYQPGGSTFEPEEDVAVEEGGAADADALGAGAPDADGDADADADVAADDADADADADVAADDADADADITSRDPEAGGGPSLDDL
ncbi:MAG: hypothetical protein JWM23_914 [Microbacteriaceae bacterium]|jgi:hypothetical protein|nr:hypothetical protein [Microbacteriaceae bacterium]